MAEEADRNDPTIMGNDAPRTDGPHHNTSADHPGRSSHHHAEEIVGETAGGISGVVAGAAIGALGGPVGAVIGGIAGAVGGWWAGKAIVDVASDLDDKTDQYYRARFEANPRRTFDYERARPAYHLGHLASRNPDYAGRDFEEIESDLQHGWTGATVAQHGEWADVREYARDAYARRPADIERPLAAADDREVHLTEAVDPNAFGDDTAVTGYAGGPDDRSEDSGERRL